MVLSPENSVLGALHKANFGSHLFQIFFAMKLFFFQNENIIQHSKITDPKEAFLIEVEMRIEGPLKAPPSGPLLLP